MNMKTEKQKSIGKKTRKTDLKNSQNRKSQSPSHKALINLLVISMF